MDLPTNDEVRALLGQLRRRQLIALAEMSGVPFRTIQKVQRGETMYPGLDTVRRFLPHIKAAAKVPAKA